MKRLTKVFAAVLMGAMCLLPATWGETGGKISPDDYQRIVEEQEAIRREFLEFLDLLDACARQNKDPEISRRLQDAIECARKADIEKQMDMIEKFAKDGEWFSAQMGALNVDGNLEDLINILTGVNTNTKIIVKEGKEKLEALLTEMNGNDAGRFDVPPQFGDASDKAGELLEGQREVKDGLENPDGRPADPAELKKREAELEKGAKNLQAMLEAMGDKAGPAAQSMQDAAESMSQAASALGQMANGSPGAKAQAGGAMDKAVKNLQTAIAQIGEAKAAAEQDLKNSKSLDQLSRQEKGIADRLNQIRNELTRALGPNSPAGKSLATAVPKSRSAASKAGKAAQNGGKSGSGGAAQDQQDARDAVEQAIKDLQDELDQMIKIEQLEDAVKALEQMLADQKEVNGATVAADVERIAWDEKNPGRPCEFARATIVGIQRACNKQQDIAERARILIRMLKDAKQTVSPNVLNDVHGDMVQVAGKLDVRDVGDETQYVEASIVQRLKWLKDSVTIDLESLKEKKNEGGGNKGGGGGKQGGDQKQPPLPSLAEIKLLRKMQMDVHYRTTQLADYYEKRMAAIEADTSLTPEAKEQMKRTVEEQKRLIGLRLASAQSRIAMLVSGIIDNASASN